MAKYDVYHIEKQLRQYDDRFSLVWDGPQERHKVMYDNPITKEREFVMAVPHGELDARVVNRIKWIDRRNGFDPFLHVEEALDKRDHDQNKKIEDMARDMADVIAKPLYEDAVYGS